MAQGRDIFDEIEDNTAATNTAIFDAAGKYYDDRENWRKGGPTPAVTSVPITPSFEAIPTFTGELAQGNIGNALSIPFHEAFGYPGNDGAIKVEQPDGSTTYKVAPLGDRFQQEGIFAPPAPTADVIKDLGLDPVEGESGLASFARGVGRGTIGLLNSLQSPVAAPMLAAGAGEAAVARSLALGVPTEAATIASESALPILKAANKFNAGAFAIDMGLTVPEQTLSLSQAQTPGEIAERGIGLGATGLFSALGAAHAVSAHPKIQQAVVAANADLPATAGVLAKQGVDDLSKTRTDVEQPENLPVIAADQPPETATSPQGDIFDQIESEGATQPTPEQPAVTPDLARTQEIQPEVVSEQLPASDSSPVVGAPDLPPEQPVQNLAEPDAGGATGPEPQARIGVNEVAPGVEQVERPELNERPAEIVPPPEPAAIESSVSEGAQPESAGDIFDQLGDNGPDVSTPETFADPTKPVIAFRGTKFPEGQNIITDPEARIHAQLYENAFNEFGKNIESGFMVGDEFVPGSASEGTLPAKIKAAQDRQVIRDNQRTFLENENREGTLNKIAGRLAIPEQDQGDFAQELNTKVLQKIKDNAVDLHQQDQANFRSWLNKTATNLKIDIDRAANAQKRAASQTVSLEEPRGESTVGEGIPARSLPKDQSVARDATTAALTPLTEREKDIIRSVIQEGETKASVAARLKMSPQNVAKILKSSLEKMRKQMAENGYSREDFDFDSDADSPNMGPGAASVLEFMLNPPKETSTKNRVADEERRLRGADAILPDAIQSNPETFDMAEALLEQNPNHGKELVSQLNNGLKTQVSEVDEAVLLQEKVDVMNQRQMEADRASDPYASEESRDAARERWEKLEAEVEAIDRATRRSGQIWGRLGQFRQRLLRDDYTLAAIERKARVAKGRPLTPEESAKIKEQADRITQLEAEKEQATIEAEKKGRDDAFAEAYKQFQAEAKATPKFSDKVLSIAESIASRLEAEADKSRAYLRNALKNTNAGVDPAVVYHVAVIGASKLARASLDFGKWSTAMVDELGEAVRPFLAEAWDQSNKMLDAEDKRVSEPIRQPVKKVRVKNATEDFKQGAIEDVIASRASNGSDVRTLRNATRRLALSYIRSGLTDRDAMVDKVHATLQKYYPSVTRDNTMDLISGYGDFKPLDTDPAKQILRAHSGEIQQLGKIRDLLAGQAPKKTGVERRTPSTEERKLAKQVNELKKKGGYELTDPETQLKSAQDAIKTRLRNEIEELDDAIINREPLVKKTGGVDYDEEALRLKDNRDQKRAEYDELFPKEPLTDQELSVRLVKSLDNSIASLEADLKSGKLYNDPRRKLTSPEIEARRSRLAALRDERDNLRNLDTARIEQQKEARLQKAIDTFDTEVETPKEVTVDTEAVSKLKGQLQKLRDDRAAGRSTDAPLQEQIKERQLEAAITRAESGETAAPKQFTADSKRVAELKEKLAAIREAREASPEVQQQKIDAATKSVEESIRELDRKLQEGDFAPKTPKEPISSPELDALRAQRDAMRKLFNELKAAEVPKKSKEEIWLQSRKTYLTNRLASMREMLAKRDFAPKEKTAYLKTKELTDIEHEIGKVKREINNELLKEKLKNRHPLARAGDVVSQTIQTARGVLTGFDFGAVLNQAGIMSISNPHLMAKNLGPMFKAFASEKLYHKFYRDLMDRPNADLYQSSKLALVDPDSAELSKMEEAYRSRWNKYIPGVAHSERAYVGFLNQIRADAFDQITNNLRDADGNISKDTADAIAYYVNVATGRGSVGGGSGIFDLNNFFFSPRLLSSRFEYLFHTPLIKALGKGDRKAAAYIAKEYAKFYLAAGVIYSLAQAAGAGIETDPRSTDFMKIRLGNIRFDLLGGLSQVATLFSRLYTGQKKSITGKLTDIRRSNPNEKMQFGGDKATDLVWRFVKNKANPILGTAFNLLDGEDITGKYFGPKEALLGYLPMSGSDIASAIKEAGPFSGTALGLFNLLGARMQVYSDDAQAKKVEATARP
jgi:RNA polymerase sigma factor (sigma-70 family)